jgi:CubicO group peptidase (beta-lactamase class C family)
MYRGWMLVTVIVAVTAGMRPTPAASGPGKGQAVERLDGSTITPAEIDATVTRVMGAAEVPGVGIAIFNHGKVTYLKAYGLRDEGKDLPLTPDSVLTAASFTKVAFGYMVMQLVQEKLLDLDKPVYQYLPKPLPEYPQYADLSGDPRYKRITARMLLSHTSGFSNFRWLNENHKLIINFDPGTRYAYSGEGIELLQFIVEAVIGKPLEELMRERIFQPFGMTRTSMVWQNRFESDYANGYDEYGRSLGPERRPKADAAGSMQTTLADFSRFLQAVMAGTRLDPATRAIMLSPQIAIPWKHEFPTLAFESTDANKAIRLSYGLGWGLYWTPYGEAFFKEGHIDGFMNYAVCFDGPKKGLLIMTNSSNGEGIYKELLETLLKNTYTPIEWEGFTPYNELPPRPPLRQHKEVGVDPKLLDRYAGRYGEPPKLIEVIRREGDHLSLQENDEPKEEIFPESANEFFSKTTDDELTFESDSAGRITRFVLHTGGKDIPLKRLD